MTDLTLKRLLLGSTLLFGLSAAPAFAQATNSSGVPEADEQSADGVFEQTITDDERDEFLDEVVDGDMDEMIVTGSRLRRDTFSSITPLQRIDTEFAADQGLFNPVEILQTSSAAAGQQIDSTFGGFVLDNGPGSETVDLRGLSAARTLVLLDGRRLGPSGVEGAPSTPSINTVPVTFIDGFDILLDGASSVYGSDAVAGVVNGILKKDFDGLEVEAIVDLPEQSGGEEFIVGASYGINADRGYIGVQGQYRKRENFKIGERDFFEGCDRIFEETVDGDIRTTDITDQFIANQLGLTDVPDECRGLGFTQSLQLPGFGFSFYQPDISNTGVSFFSDTGIAGVPIDRNGDGVVDANFEDFTRNGREQNTRDILNEQEAYSFRVTGEYTLEGEANFTPYFDYIFDETDVDGQGSKAQFFPFVSASNPFNPCNLDQPNGVDCGAAYNAVLTSPDFLARFADYYTNPALSGTSDCFGLGAANCDPRAFRLAQPEGISRVVRPVVGIAGDRNITDVTIQTQRILAGARTDLPFLNVGPLSGATFDISALHSIANSDSRRPGIRQDRLALALGDTGIGGVPCAAAPGTPADVVSGCVPVNLFAPSLYNSTVEADFATQAERDYLFDDRDFATSFNQTTIEAVLSAGLFEFPGGTVQAAIGAQYRVDDIDSLPDRVAAEGLFFGFFADRGASGDRTQKELFGEISLPLGTGQEGFREFTVDLAGRLTDDEFYGTNETYSVKAGWRPIDALLVRGTYGTSFRAPTVRELFLAGQTGFNQLFDPCAAPEAIGTAQDTRSEAVLEQCRAEGLDPLTFSPGNPLFSTEISSGGTAVGDANVTLDPETSTSFTVGASFDQPFTDAFDLELGVTYYEYDIEDTFTELTATQIINNCYDDELGQDPDCIFITRDFNDAGTPGRYDVIFEQFVNRDNETARGIDLSADLFVNDVNVLENNVDFFLQSRVNRQNQRREFDIATAADGTPIIDEEELVGEFNFSKWRGFATYGVGFDKFRLSLTSRYIGGVKVDEEDLDLVGFGNALNTDFDILSTVGSDFGDVDAQRVSTAGDYWRHSASLRYAYDEDFNILIGVDNVFDRDPPLVDGREVFSISNVSTGGGYDLFGRSFFAQIQKRF